MAEAVQLPTTLVDWLDDLTVRFLLNLPASELSSVPRLCFQVEEAQWFYEDFVRPAVAASGAIPLPSLHLRQFCLLLFQHCPLLNGFTDAQHIAAYEEFLAYKVRVPVRGAILLDHDMDNIVLVKGWKKGASWSFPRGKINKDEKDLDCAIREVYEETGYDVREAGLVPENEKEVKFIDITMREQHMRLFVFRNVPEDTHFEPKTRKEISKIQWYSIRDLPGFKKQKPGQHVEGGAAQASKFYMVAPFLGPLKKWITQQRRKDAEIAEMVVADDGYAAQQTATEDEGDVEEESTPEREVPVAVAVADKSEELKRLLSIGNPAPAQQSQAPDAHAGNLLAMLRGPPNSANGNQQPRTPFEQINAFPPQPHTPQPDHLRHRSMNPWQQQPPPPQFPFSPPNMHHEQQRNYSLPTPAVFRPGPGPGFPHPHQNHGFPPMAPPPPFQQQHFQQRQSMPGPPPPGLPFGPHNGMPPPPQYTQPSLPPQQMRPPPPVQQHPPNAYAVQGPQGAIASGPAVPNASQLPPPKLDPSRMRLLDALREGSSSRPVVGSSSAAAAAARKTTNAATTESQQRQPRAASVHQTALLGLFKKPPPSSGGTSQPLAAATDESDGPPSPTLTDAISRPARPPRQERKPTLNEITRTLPAKLKVKSPTVAEPRVRRPEQAPPAPTPATEVEQPESREAEIDLPVVSELLTRDHLPRPAPETQPDPPKSRSERPLAVSDSSVRKPRPGPDQAQSRSGAQPEEIESRELRPGRPAVSDSSLRKPRPGSDQTQSRKLFDPSKPMKFVPATAPKEPALDTPQPPATILQPPPSKRASRSPKPKQASASISPSRTVTQNGRQSSAFTILPRPGSSRGLKSPALVVPPTAVAPLSPLRRDETEIETPKPAFHPQVLKRPRNLDVGSPMAGTVEPSQSVDKKDQLLALFGKSPALAPPTEPAALEEKPNPPENALPNLFTPPQGSQQPTRLAPPPAPRIEPERKPSSQNARPARQQDLLLNLFNKSTGHGTPVTSPGTPISPFTLETPAARSRLGSVASTGGSSASASTPVEAKEFLMGYLNGVVRDEGYRGAGGGQRRQ